MKKRDNVVLITRVVAVVIILFIVGFYIFSQVIGGTALLGNNEDGAFFVGNHGELIEVSELAWHISKIWELAVWTLYALFFCCGIFAVIIGLIVLFYRKKKIDPTENANDVKEEGNSNMNHDKNKL